MDSSQSRGLILTAHSWTKYFIVFDAFAQVLFSGVYMFAATLPLYRIFYIFAGIHVLFCGLDTWFYFGVRKVSGDISWLTFSRVTRQSSATRTSTLLNMVLYRWG
ncbi:hypothetical protein DSO57_1010432 [Entomophthora muscae]|uniref:Uncharacterized protein n=1 Tax=Entomophthora muscae TaxID=34485 RepID=A0ACC2RXK2_9FUNG|nr:hypothetical protein DSO57_1010432 [Entomophthora muscae]